MFVDLDQNGKELLGSLVSGLIELTTIDNCSPGAKSSGLATAAQKTLSKVLTAIPAFHFVHATLFMLGSENTIVR